MKTLWIEEYKKCGCSVGPIPKHDLPGYCAKHGNDYKNRYPVSGPGFIAIKRVFRWGERHE